MADPRATPAGTEAPWSVFLALAAPQVRAAMSGLGVERAEALRITMRHLAAWAMDMIALAPEFRGRRPIAGLWIAQQADAYLVRLAGAVGLDDHAAEVLVAAG